MANILETWFLQDVPLVDGIPAAKYRFACFLASIKIFNISRSVYLNNFFSFLALSAVFNFL